MRVPPRVLDREQTILCRKVNESPAILRCTASRRSCIAPESALVVIMFLSVCFALYPSGQGARTDATVAP